ncbi:MAG: insulinase family protein, partial [Acidimicrobiales bacterium]
STIAANNVTVVSESPGGSGELVGDDSVIATLATEVVAASGVGPWDPVQVQRFLSSRDVGGGPYITDVSEGWSGSAATEDLEVLFQLMHLSLTQPRVDDVPFDQQIEFARDTARLIDLDAGFAADIALADARSGGGAFAALPSNDAIEALTADDALRIYRDRFSRLDDHVVVVVGDVTESTVADLARRYIGTLPASFEVERPEPFPAPGATRQDLTAGSGSSSGAYRFATYGEADETVEAQVLAELTTSILDDRLFTVVREELGATYGGFASIQFEDPGDLGALLISIDGDPERLDEIANAVQGELSTIAAGGLSSADFREAVAVLESRYNFINNGVIIESLFDEARESADRIVDRDRQWDALQQLDPGDVAAFVTSLTESSDQIDIRAKP